MNKLTVGTQIRHYKGSLYKIIGTCRIEATLKLGILYKIEDGSEEVTWMRPADEFFELVITSEGKVPRFSVIEATATATA